jgi:UDPglucose 6-dehydrogenase
MRRDWVLRLVHREILPRQAKPTFGILGLAYKENTHSTKNSPSLALIANLQSWPIRVYDPAVPASAVAHPAVGAAASALEAARGSDALLIMTPWPEFRGLSPTDLAVAMRGRVIVDPFRMLAGEAFRAAGFSYFTLGVPPLHGTKDR